MAKSFNFSKCSFQQEQQKCLFKYPSSVARGQIFLIPRAHSLYEKSKRPAFSVPKQISDVIINICLRKNKSKQTYVWINSTFEAQSICFGTEKAVVSWIFHIMSVL